MKTQIGIARLKPVIRSDYFILLIMATIYVIVVSTLSIMAHYAFYTNAWDLGIYTQSLHTTLNNGRFLYYTAELPGNPSGCFFGIHFSPFLFLILPIYAIFQNPVTLLVLQPIAVAAGLIPLYWIVRERLPSKALLFTLAIMYLVYPPTLIQLSNFSLAAFLPMLFLFALYYMNKGKLFRSFVFILLALMVNEFVPFIVIATSFYYFLLHRKGIWEGLKRRSLSKDFAFSIALLIIGVLWFKLATSVIAYYNPNALNTKWEWGEFGSSPSDIVYNVFTNPLMVLRVLYRDGQNKLFYLTSLLGPLGFLSLLSPLTLIMSLPWFAASMLSINPLYYSIEAHYANFVAPFIFVSAVEGMKRLINFDRKDIVRKVTFLMLMLLFLNTLLLPEGKLTSANHTNDPIKIALARIQDDPSASASVMPEVFPHLANRLEVYPYFKDGVDYALVDIYSWWYDTTFPRPANVAPKWSEADIGNDYGLLINANGVLLYKKGYNESPLLFEGVNLTYSCYDLSVPNGKIAQDNITIGESSTMAEVLVHQTNETGSLFFLVPQQTLPPGTYRLAITLKASPISSGNFAVLEATSEPRHIGILTQNIGLSSFTVPNEWQTLNFRFALKKPTSVGITMTAANVTNLYFYSMNVLQVSGSASP